jgi:hypothetical protein
MREILNRYAKGLPLGGKDLNTAIWDEESEGINPKTLDLVDLENIERMNAEKIEKEIENQQRRKYAAQKKKEEQQQQQQQQQQQEQ